MDTDRIEKTVVLRAPRSTVWRALSTPDAFGEWFGVRLSGSFAPGAHLRGKVTQPGYENYPFEITIEHVEPDHLLSWRWHPNAVDPKVDYSTEPQTFVTFEIQDAPGGTQFRVVESGFDAIPASRRREAYQGNEKGWAMQIEAINQYIAKAA
jgi:uncharacterized protein YndB with AHSA1/START domain